MVWGVEPVVTHQTPWLELDYYKMQEEEAVAEQFWCR